jgi:hypothetical protein
MDETPNQPLDRLTKIVAQAGGIGDEEAERIGSSPFLHARLQAGIEAQRRLRAEQGGGWLATLLVASRAITALALVTIAALLTFWFSKSSAPDKFPVVYASADDISRVVTGGACALSTTAECAISTEEVLATLFAENGLEVQK